MTRPSSHHPHSIESDWTNWIWNQSTNICKINFSNDNLKSIFKFHLFQFCREIYIYIYTFKRLLSSKLHVLLRIFASNRCAVNPIPPLQRPTASNLPYAQQPSRIGQVHRVTSPTHGCWFRPAAARWLMAHCDRGAHSAARPRQKRSSLRRARAPPPPLPYCSTPRVYYSTV